MVSRGNARPPAVQSISGSTSSLEARFNALEMDLQTANAALVMKREQVSFFQALRVDKRYGWRTLEMYHLVLTIIPLY